MQRGAAERLEAVESNQRAVRNRRACLFVVFFLALMVAAKDAYDRYRPPVEVLTSETTDVGRDSQVLGPHEAEPVGVKEHRPADLEARIFYDIPIFVCSARGWEHHWQVHAAWVQLQPLAGQLQRKPVSDKQWWVDRTRKLIHDVRGEAPECGFSDAQTARLVVRIVEESQIPWSRIGFTSDEWLELSRRAAEAATDDGRPKAQPPTDRG